MYIEAQGCVPVLLENLNGMSCSGTCWPLVLGFSVGMEAFDSHTWEYSGFFDNDDDDDL